MSIAKRQYLSGWLNNQYLSVWLNIVKPPDQEEKSIKNVKYQEWEG